jgi:hypothetical protein
LIVLKTGLPSIKAGRIAAHPGLSAHPAKAQIDRAGRHMPRRRVDTIPEDDSFAER